MDPASAHRKDLPDETIGEFATEVGHALDTLALATSQLLRRSDVVTISVTPTVAAKLLIPRLGELRELLPQIELRTVATEALSDFDRDQVDIAVRLTRGPLRAELESRVLFRQETVAVASPHLLHGMTLPLSNAQLQKLPLFSSVPTLLHQGVVS